MYNFNFNRLSVFMVAINMVNVKKIQAVRSLEYLIIVRHCESRDRCNLNLNFEFYRSVNKTKTLSRHIFIHTYKPNYNFFETLGKNPKNSRLKLHLPIVMSLNCSTLKRILYNVLNTYILYVNLLSKY